MKLSKAKNERNKTTIKILTGLAVLALILLCFPLLERPRVKVQENHILPATKKDLPELIVKFEGDNYVISTDSEVKITVVEFSSDSPCKVLTEEMISHAKLEWTWSNFIATSEPFETTTTGQMASSGRSGWRRYSNTHPFSPLINLPVTLKFSIQTFFDDVAKIIHPGEYEVRLSICDGHGNTLLSHYANMTLTAAENRSE